MQHFYRIDKFHLNWFLSKECYLLSSTVNRFQNLLYLLMKIYQHNLHTLSFVYRKKFFVCLLNIFKPVAVPTHTFPCLSAYTKLVWLLLNDEGSFCFCW